MIHWTLWLLPMHDSQKQSLLSVLHSIARCQGLQCDCNQPSDPACAMPMAIELVSALQSQKPAARFCHDGLHLHCRPSFYLGII